MFMCVNVKESSIPQAVWLMKNMIHFCALLCIFRQKLMGGKHVCMFYLEQTGVTDMGML